MIKFDENKNITEEYKNYVSNLEREELEIVYIGADAYVNRLNNDIKILLKENEAKEKVIIKQDNVLNELEKLLIEDYNWLDEYGDALAGSAMGEIKRIQKKLNELKESDK